MMIFISSKDTCNILSLKTENETLCKKQLTCAKYLLSLAKGSI